MHCSITSALAWSNNARALHTDSQKHFLHTKSSGPGESGLALAKQSRTDWETVPRDELGHKQEGNRRRIGSLSACCLQEQEEKRLAALAAEEAARLEAEEEAARLEAEEAARVAAEARQNEEMNSAGSRRRQR